MFKVAIYTLTRDRLDYTKRMFEQLKKCGYEYDHFVLDNGSTDGTQDWLKEQNLKWLHLSDDNKGLWKGIDIILKENDYFEDYDFVLKLDNDLEFPEDGWLKKLIDVYIHTDYEIISPFVEGICNGAGGPPRIKTEGNLSEVGHCGGACLFTDPYYYHDLLMPNGGKSMGWDTWFCNGRDCAIVEDIHVKHDTLEQERTMPDYYARKVKEATEKYAE